MLKRSEVRFDSRKGNLGITLPQIDKTARFLQGMVGICGNEARLQVLLKNKLQSLAPRSLANMFESSLCLATAANGSKPRERQLSPHEHLFPGGP